MEIPELDSSSFVDNESSSLPLRVSNESYSSSVDQHNFSSIPVSDDNKNDPSSVVEHGSLSLPVSVENKSNPRSADEHNSSSVPVSVENKNNARSVHQHNSSSLPVSVDKESDPRYVDECSSSSLHVRVGSESNLDSVDQHCSSSLTINADIKSHSNSVDQHSSSSSLVSTDNECAHNSISVDQHCSSPLPLNADNENRSSTVYQHYSASLPVSAGNEMKHDTSTSNTSVTLASPLSLVTETISSSMAGSGRKGSVSEIRDPETSAQSGIKAEKSYSENCDGDIADEDAYEEVDSPSTTTDNHENQCKILTKYIYISKPAKIKTGKKRLGLLYKQAFRHFQRSTVNLKSPLVKHLSVLEKKRAKRQTEEESGKCVGKKGKKKGGKGRSAKKNAGAATRDGKAVSTAKGKRSKENVPLEKQTMPCRRKSPRKSGKNKSVGLKQDDEVSHPSRGRPKGKKRRTVSLSEKVDIAKQLEIPSVTLSSIAKSYNITKTALAKISKDKDKILDQHGSKVGAKKRKSSKAIKKVNNVSKMPVIKIERCDDDIYEQEVGFNLDSADDVKDFPLDAMSHFPGRKKPGRGRSRKELTLQEKVEMIRELEQPQVKVKHVAQMFGVSTSAVSRIRKHKDRIMSRSLSGDHCHEMRRSRECKDPLLDKVLLKWYRAIEAVADQPISVTNTLLQDKAREIAMAMGKTYFPSVNWIIRWKYRHNIKCKSGRIESKEKLDELDSNVNMTDIIIAVEGQLLHSDMLPDGTNMMENGVPFQKPDKFIVCEHCGIMISRHKDKRRNVHLKDCPLSCKSQRRDLTLGEKAQVVRALERPGTKMVFLAKKYGVSSSAISRIHKNRVDILARCAGSYVNVRRKRDRVGKEPEVERTLCDWYRQQLEYGYHVSGSTIREKAHEIAAVMGKDFWPSDSWVFRWRHRNNVNAIGGLEEMESLEEEVVEEMQDEDMEKTDENGGQLPPLEDDNQQKKKKKGKKRKVVEEDGCEEEEKAKPKFPRSVMCEKCGCVSDRLKRNRIRNMRHAKGCPDLKPRHELTYEERVKLLKALEEPGATLSSVARSHGISASSMSRMNKKKACILNRGVDFACQKRIRDCKEPEVAKLLYTWFMEKQQEGIHVTGTKLKEKAGALAKERGREFKASTGWLGRWKHRYNVIFRPKEDEKPVRDNMPRKKSFKKKGSPILKDEESIETLESNHQMDGSSGSVITILPDESQPLQTPRMFLAQRYQNPWAVNHQPPSSCARPKDFVPGPTHAVPDESHVPYPYDHVPRHMFHNMFENFATAASYPVSMVEPSIPVRDYMPPDETEVQQAGSSHHHHHHHHHPPIIPHQQPALTLQSAGMSQLHPVQSHQSAMHHASHSPANSVHEELQDSVQQQQIMEACKLMNSFAKEKSLGEHVQAALRTIEMTLKGNERKVPQRSTYTHI